MKKPSYMFAYEVYNMSRRLYCADEMDAYIAHLETQVEYFREARDEAIPLLSENYDAATISTKEWLSKYSATEPREDASEKVEGGGE